MMHIVAEIRYSLREKRRDVSGAMSKRDSTTGNDITCYLRCGWIREHERAQ